MITRSTTSELPAVSVHTALSLTPSGGSRWFAYSFYLLLGWGLAVQVFLMVIGATHSWALSSAVRSMRSRRAPGTHVIEETYRSLLWMCLAFIGSTTVLNANFVFVA